MCAESCCHGPGAGAVHVVIRTPRFESHIVLALARRSVSHETSHPSTEKAVRTGLTWAVARNPACGLWVPNSLSGGVEGEVADYDLYRLTVGRRTTSEEPEIDANLGLTSVGHGARL